MENYNKIQEIIQEQVRKMQAEQDRITKERLKEYLGYEIDLEKEMQRLFPRITIVKYGYNRHSVVWNDGTEQGYTVVSFTMNGPSHRDVNSLDDNSYTLGFTYF